MKAKDYFKLRTGFDADKKISIDTASVVNLMTDFANYTREKETANDNGENKKIDKQKNIN